MKPLTVKHIRANSEPHPTAKIRGGDARVYREHIGDYVLSIVGGGIGLYGDFVDDFEVALIDEKTGKFVTGAYSKRGDDVMGFASIDEINDLYFNIPRKF